MSLRIVIVISLLVLCGLSTMSPASGMRCNIKDCGYYPDQEPVCRGPGVVECPEGDDLCGTLAGTLGSGTSFMTWNCTRTTLDDCNEQKTCDHIRELVVEMEDTIESCSITCCDTNECNAPDKKQHDQEIETITKKFHWPFH